MANILEVKNLNYTIGKIKILDNVNFYIPSGKICAFLGRNGAGKSTTIKCILGLIRNYDNGGGITCNGEFVSSPVVRKFIGYVPENDALPKMSAFNFLLEQAMYIGLSRNDAIKQIKCLCRAFDFSYDRLQISTNHFSSGVKKTIILIQSLLGSPKLVIMDEPTLSLDFETRLLFYKLITKLKHKGISFFISTHNLFEIKNFAD
jgi:ABC-2 type transport system ATP-binding protein